MLRFLAGVGSTLALVAAGIFLWRSHADAEDPVPPSPAPLIMPQQQAPAVEAPPAATEKTKEEKRFARADKDDDGRITRDEMLEPRRKAFAKLDKNGDGRLAFEEWAVTTTDKFAGADGDRSGWLSPAEYATTRPKPPKQKKCAC